ILEMIDDQIAAAIDRLLADDYGAASFAEYASNRLGVEFEASDFRGTAADAARGAQEKATAMVPTTIQELTEENLNPDEEPKDWKWHELTRAMNARYGLKLTDKELRKIPVEE